MANKTNKIIILIITIITIIIAAGGCINPEKGEGEKGEGEKEGKEKIQTNDLNTNTNPPEFVSVVEVITRCVDECKSRKDKEDLNTGPCLSNEIAPGWVCDIAHDPREEVDNKPENQCPAFREGKSDHFVELDPGCNLIKAY